LVQLGVDVRTGRVVDHIGSGVLGIAGERLPVGLVVWAAGVAASPLGESLGIPTDRLGRVSVESDLRVVGWPEVFALGDVALCLDAEGKPLPGLAQVAKQQGVHLGKALGNRFVRGAEVPPFVYRSRGNTAIVGRHAAIYETTHARFTGWPAWLLWAIVHVFLLVGFQHRVLVSVQWLWRYLTYERGARLISSQDPAP
jgi:NADH dehydrogenase